jgi:predicted nuclease of predicted toxin-antitoxin system
MRFKVDENLPAEVAAALRDAGHDAPTVLDQEAGGMPDTSLAALVKQEARALLTLDQGFADLRSYPPAEYAGLVVLRLKKQDKLHLLSVMPKLIATLKSEPLKGRVWIVEESRIRIRGASEPRE